MEAFECDHLEQAAHRDHGIAPGTPGCKECLERGDDWVHLRLCLTCGHVGCCDDSPNQHASLHYHQTLHPVIRSFEPGERWAYCYADDTLLEELRAPPIEQAQVHYTAHW